MTQLIEVLRKLHWGAYEASVYDALVAGGPLKASDIALKAKVPSGRIYNVLIDLEKKGYVRRKGKRPTVYDAQNPRFVMEKEMETMRVEVDSAIAKAEEAWEIRSERHENGFENAWSVSGVSGIVSEFRRLAEETKKSILILDPQLDWLQRKDQELLSRLSGQGDVRVISSPISKEDMETLMAEKVKARMTDDADEAFYIFDGATVLLRVNSPDGAAIFKSEPTAATLTKRFEEVYRKAKEIDVKKVEA